MFLFQTSGYKSHGKKQESLDVALQKLQVQFMEVRRMQTPSSLVDYCKAAEAFSKSLSTGKFAATSSETARAQAFLVSSLEWLSSKGSIQAKDILGAIAAPQRMNTAQYEKNLSTYSMLIGEVADACLHSKGYALSFAAMEQLSSLLVTSKEAGGRPAGSAYFTFPSQAHADSLTKYVFARLNASTKSEQGMTADLLGADYATQNPYAVRVSSISYGKKEGVQAPPIASDMEPAPATSSVIMKKRYTRVEQTVSPPMENFERSALAAAGGKLSQFSQSEGEAGVSSESELFYIKKKDPESAKGNAALAKLSLDEVLFDLATSMNFDIDHAPDLMAFLVSDEGKRFREAFNKNIRTISASASMEVFYNGKNYEAYRDALIDNWGYANHRATLLRNALSELNGQILEHNKQNGTEIKTFNVPEQTSSTIFLFQDISPELKQRLLSDAKLSQEVKAWLLDGYKEGEGQLHMGQLMTFLQQNSRGAAWELTYEKLAGAIGTQNIAEQPDGTLKVDLSEANFALLGSLFQRMPSDETLSGKKAKKTASMEQEMRQTSRLRNESDPSPLVKAIEKCGTVKMDGASGRQLSRSVGLSAEANSFLGITVNPVASQSKEPGSPGEVQLSVKYMLGGKEIPFDTDKHGDLLVGVVTGGKVLPLSSMQIQKTGEGQYLAKFYMPEMEGDYQVVALARTSDKKLNSGFAGVASEVKAAPPKRQVQTVDRPFEVTFPLDLRFKTFDIFFNYSSSVKLQYGAQYAELLSSTVLSARELLKQGDEAGGLNLLFSNLYDPSNPNSLYSQLSSLPANNRYRQAWENALLSGYSLAQFLSSIGNGDFAAFGTMLNKSKSLGANTNYTEGSVRFTDFNSLLSFVQYQITTHQINTSFELTRTENGFVNLFLVYEKSHGTFTFRDFPLTKQERDAGNFTVMAGIFPTEQVAAFVSAGASLGRSKTMQFSRTDISQLRGFNTSVGMQYDFVSGFLKGIRAKGELTYEKYWVKQENTWSLSTQSVTGSVRLSAKDFIGQVWKPYYEGSLAVTPESLERKQVLGTSRIGVTLKPFSGMFENVGVDLSGAIRLTNLQEPYGEFRINIFTEIGGPATAGYTVKRRTKL